MKRGEIYYADLGKNFGSVQSGIRLVCVVQNNIGNQYSPTTIICPLTSQDKPNLPTHIKITETPKISTILCEQIMVIDKRKIFQEKVIYTLNEKQIDELDNAIKSSLSITN